ncbi:MAG: hypothetical protein O9267_08145 [Flavobacterium sp.]|uniref:hypothetical protein n=1 Tax=Flavobacterium sp. TaxID=239 RepID=UPI0022CCB98A|nr:hypothetical protein [Flavobacterium sp.]MCZ8197562.1 hypothetical protein [Flavobacterium sp.]
MKKALIVLLLFPLLVSAKFYKAKITLTNGTSKNGFIELPEYPDDAKIKFKAEEKGKVEKFSLEEVTSFEITNDKMETINYVTLKLAEQSTFNLNKIKPGDKKVWARIVKEGKISIYSTYSAYDFGTKTGGAGTFYIKRQNEDFALFLEEFGGDGISLCMNCFPALKKTLKGYFETACPKLSELVTKEELKKKGISYLVDLYEQNCGK